MSSWLSGPGNSSLESFLLAQQADTADPDPRSPLNEKGVGSPTRGSFLLLVPSPGGRGPCGRPDFDHQLLWSRLPALHGSISPLPKDTVEQVALDSYRADSYLVPAVGSLGGLLPENGPIPPPCSSLSSGNVAEPSQWGEPLSSWEAPGGWEGENKQWLSGFSRQA